MFRLVALLAVLGQAASSIVFSRSVVGIGPDGSFDLLLDTDPSTGGRAVLKGTSCMCLL
jgi:hypothetical protein